MASEDQAMRVQDTKRDSRSPEAGVRSLDRRDSDAAEQDVSGLQGDRALQEVQGQDQSHRLPWFFVHMLPLQWQGILPGVQRQQGDLHVAQHDATSGRVARTKDAGIRAPERDVGRMA